MNVTRFKSFNVEISDKKTIILTNIPAVFTDGHKYERLEDVPANVLQALIRDNTSVLMCFTADWLLKAEIEKCEQAGVRYRGVGMAANTPLAAC